MFHELEHIYQTNSFSFNTFSYYIFIKMVWIIKAIQNICLIYTKSNKTKKYISFLNDLEVGRGLGKPFKGLV